MLPVNPSRIDVVLVPVGIGFDLVDLKRFGALYGDFDPEVLGRCFSKDELECVGKGEDRLTRLAARFAAKEAVLKVLGGLQDGISLTEIVVASNSSGKPHLTLSGGALTAAQAAHIDSWMVSLTHTESTAGAVALGFSAGPK